MYGMFAHSIFVLPTGAGRLTPGAFNSFPASFFLYSKLYDIHEETDFFSKKLPGVRTSRMHGVILLHSKMVFGSNKLL